MNLSADFHESKNSCTLNSALQSATSVTDLAESAILEAAPLIIDLVLAFVYLTISLGSYEGFTIVATGVVFFVMTKRLLITSERHSRRRLKAIYDQVAISDAALRGWHTSSAFGQIGFEENRHADAITSRWLEEQGYTASWGSSRATQAAILTCGFSITAFLATIRVKHGQATPGKLAMLLVYWSQLMGPLKLFSAFGQRFADRIVDTELLLQTMQMTPSVESHKIARPLKLAAGHIQFDNICFQYGNGREILKGLILQVPAGSTTAFVGSSGGGLSTILKLVSRFYDVTSGAILIDGQDIRNVDLFSLRQRVGLVPQQILLFNDTIMNNIRYAKVTASDVQVLEACYHTTVGENGIKLSSGELQRIAIARVWLQQPDIVLLDDATGSIDTDTEEKVQKSLKDLCASRTTLVTSNKLSTIMAADLIVVIDDGKVTEQGIHEELLNQKGRYADLWMKQLPANLVQKGRIINTYEKPGVPVSKLANTGVAQHPVSSQITLGAVEERKLNPVAPTFKPRSMDNSESSARRSAQISSEDSDVGHRSKTSTAKTSIQWSDEVSAEEEKSKVSGNSSKGVTATHDDTANGKTVDPVYPPTTSQCIHEVTEHDQQSSNTTKASDE
ncbi:hypothetical protein N3K66_005884 [Trichothecium roseum]|uniref:Uncharacterized protein n=1 Tax=Trichothecium roseum TaxID=47278 RepID=A0ACC0UZ50_9HYPO|nr:hypothetical protein N3K66_005884 [Trichothecium roseum]